jgi:uncharacterized membrane protein
MLIRESANGSRVLTYVLWGLGLVLIFRGLAVWGVLLTANIVLLPKAEKLPRRL